MHRSAFQVLSLLVFMGMLSSTQIASAQGVGDGSSLVQVQMTPSVHRIHPGERFFLAFRFEMADDWHIYWTNPGDSGKAPMITIDSPDGFKVGSILWPRPMRMAGPMTTFGYVDETVLFVPVLAPKELSDGGAAFKATVDWLVCKEECLVGSASVSTVVHTTSALADSSHINADAVDPPSRKGKPFDDAKLGEFFRTHLPHNLARVKRASVVNENSTLIITGPARGFTTLDVFPDPSPGISMRLVEKSIAEDAFRVVLKVVAGERADSETKGAIARGVIALGDKPDDPSFAFDVPLRPRKSQKESGTL